MKHRKDLSEADLWGANLWGAKNLPIRGATQVFGSRHAIYVLGENVSIGCYTSSISDWLEGYPITGEENGYSTTEIREYGEYLRAIQIFTETIKGINKG